MKILIFCPSYTSLLPALGVIEKNKTEDVILIISDSRLYKFLESTTLSKYSLGYVNLNIPIFSKNPLHYLKVYLQYEYVFNKHFKNIKNYNIYFFVKLWFEFGFMIIKRLAKDNNVFYYDCYPPNDFSNAKHNIIKEFLLQKVFGLEMKVFSLEYDISKLKNLYFRENNIKILENISYPSNIGEILLDKSMGDNLKNKKVLILLEGLEYTKGVDAAKYGKAWEQILGILKEQYGEDEILVKEHPRFKTIITPLKKYSIDELSVIPAEIIQSIHQFNLIVGISSTAMFFPSNEKTKIISVIELFELPEKMKYHFSFHVKRNKKIFLPVNLNNFRKCLSKQS